MATKQIAWQTGGGNITLTYTGSGNGTISVASDDNNGTARSQTIIIQTTKGGLVTKNVTVKQAACTIPAGTVLNFAYTGSHLEVLLPAGQYKLQCWGAQGGSNAANSSYGITAQAGGKGGYSEGVLTLTSKTTVRIYVGAAGSSSAGGFNGGGSTVGSSSYNSGDEQGVSCMGGGGGATDIRLSDGALLSRMIVAGGGSGGAMCYKKAKSSYTTWEDSGYVGTYLSSTYKSSWSGWTHAVDRTIYSISYTASNLYFSPGDKIRITVSGGTQNYVWQLLANNVNNTATINNITGEQYNKTTGTFTIPNLGAEAHHLRFMVNCDVEYFNGSFIIEKQTTHQSVIEENSYQVGFVGGGTTGGGYSSTYQGKQNAAGAGGSFGQGANQASTNYRYCSGAGGGGWYGGGGGQNSDSSITYCKYSGGGSGFVNTSASAGNRPSGYTGLQLDSGETKAGNTSFPAPGGGTETGHSGNGYARITRLS